MIAHRLLAAADLSVVIERGNIVGTGKLEHLMAIKRFYYHSVFSIKAQAGCKDWTHRDRSTNAYPTKGYISILRNQR